ncbi:MAG: hypothetical protein FJX74_24070, partial [Armatimonadetes bacterium]|nr:hypothetical protein [Armatimonadota bacterium]
MRFSTVDLSPLRDLALEGLTPPWHRELAGRLASMPTGQQAFWGIPFALAPEGGPRWLALRGQEVVAVPLAGRASYVVVAHFCNPLGDENHPGLPGEPLAHYALAYADGAEHRVPIRRCFEICDPWLSARQLVFAARPHRKDTPVDWRGPYARGAWGWSQTATQSGGGAGPVYWLYAMPNPGPERELVALRLEPAGADLLAVAGITLYHGRAHPLQHRRLQALRVILPQQEAALAEELAADVDLGVIARQYAVPAFDGERWLAAPLQGWGEEPPRAVPRVDLRLEVSASTEATLTVGGHAVSLGPVYETGAGASHDGAVRVELLDRERTWVHVTVEEASNGHPTPARVHFRSPDGRYLPPYGHRREVNDHWFEDYGADLKLGSTEYAYVDGRFQIELPVGEVYVEVAKGFEYRPLRQRLEIKPGQRELRLKLERPFDLRSKGWVTADTHVHFLSPQTAWLEAQAEGINLVNLLASQWGDLFTNVGDITGELSGVSRADTLVWVGTENRQHLLGHISLLGVQGTPIFPMTTDGPDESYIGDPLASSMAEWADRCRQQEGLVVIPHFPDPYLEVAADIILGKVDGAEIRTFTPELDHRRLREWYRFLNLGYRVAAVGGTDKMSAGMPLGGVRTYAHLGDEEFDFAGWARAVRAGHTFTTSGPLIGLSVEGRAPGDEIRLPGGGGTVEVEAWVDSLQPVHKLQVVA